MFALTLLSALPLLVSSLGLTATGLPAQENLHMSSLPRSLSRDQLFDDLNQLVLRRTSPLEELRLGRLASSNELAATKLPALKNANALSLPNLLALGQYSHERGSLPFDRTDLLGGRHLELLASSLRITATGRPWLEDLAAPSLSKSLSLGDHLTELNSSTLDRISRLEGLQLNLAVCSLGSETLNRSALRELCTLSVPDSLSLDKHLEGFNWLSLDRPGLLDGLWLDLGLAPKRPELELAPSNSSAKLAEGQIA